MCSPNAQEAVRLLAVSALMEGRDRVAVADLFKVLVKAVDNWWERWRAAGRDALLSRPRGRRVDEHQVLSEAEQAAARQAALDQIPSDLDLSGRLWARGQMMCRFLSRLVGHFDHKVHLIVDRHPAHRSKAVRAWLADHQDWIELHFLPSYSPELNPDELVNADLKRSLPHTHRGPGTKPNSPPKPADSSTADNVSHTSSAATSAARTSAVSWTRTP
ncbi:transposase [Streptomyces sp. NPDC017524]